MPCLQLADHTDVCSHGDPWRGGGPERCIGSEGVATQMNSCNTMVRLKSLSSQRAAFTAKLQPKLGSFIRLLIQGNILSCGGSGGLPFQEKSGSVDFDSGRWDGIHEARSAMRTAVVLYQLTRYQTVLLSLSHS